MVVIITKVWRLITVIVKFKKIHLLSISEDELDELMKEMDEYVDMQHVPVASPLSPGTAFSLQYTSSHFVVKVYFPHST